MNEQELVIAIGNEICEGCGPGADCGEDPDECVRVATAIGLLGDYHASQQDNSADPNKSCSYCGAWTKQHLIGCPNSDS